MEKSLIGKDPNQTFYFSGGYIFQRTRASVQSGPGAGLMILNVPRDNILVLGHCLLLSKY